MKTNQSFGLIMIVAIPVLMAVTVYHRLVRQIVVAGNDSNRFIESPAALFDLGAHRGFQRPGYCEPQFKLNFNQIPLTDGEESRRCIGEYLSQRNFWVFVLNSCSASEHREWAHKIHHLPFVIKRDAYYTGAIASREIV